VTSTYRELAPPPHLRRHLACIWSSHDGVVNVLPDGCVDIVFERGRLVVAGPATTATVVSATPGQDRFGVRFRVGAAGAALGVAASELCDDQVALADLWGAAGRRLDERVASTPSTSAGLAALVAGVAERVAAVAGGDPLVRRAAEALVAGAAFHDVCRVVGAGDRQLRRRFERAVGYGPATLVRVQRFQCFLALATAGPALSVGQLAADAGYADQAHLTRESRRLSGLTPVQLLAGGAVAAGDKSVLFKPSMAELSILAG
jgi:AraC-like DNA-binding protein